MQIPAGRRTISATVLRPGSHREVIVKVKETHPVKPNKETMAEVNELERRRNAILQRHNLRRATEIDFNELGQINHQLGKLQNPKPVNIRRVRSVPLENTSIKSQPQERRFQPVPETQRNQARRHEIIRQVKKQVSSGKISPKRAQKILRSKGLGTVNIGKELRRKKQQQKT